MSNTIKLLEIMRDAISDYAANAEGKTNAEWLQGYLGKTLSDKSIDKLHAISSEITSTLDLMDEKKASLENAIKVGESAESWFTKETMKESNGSGEKARMAAEFLNGITSAEQSYDSSIDGEIIDVDAEDWEDDKWNDYRLKDSLKAVASEAGKAGLREIASEVFLKASEEGVASVLGDSEFVKTSLEKGTVTGIKVAVSAGLAVAEERGFIPPTSFQVIATTAHKTVENLTVFNDVVKGRATMTEALVHIKNTAVSTFSGMWQQHKDRIKGEIIEDIGSIFGLKGAVIAGAITGLLTPPQEGSRLVNAVKEAGRSAWNFLTKERHITIFSKIKNKLFS